MPNIADELYYEIIYANVTGFKSSCRLLNPTIPLEIIWLHVCDMHVHQGPTSFSVCWHTGSQSTSDLFLPPPPLCSFSPSVSHPSPSWWAAWFAGVCVIWISTSVSVYRPDSWDVAAQNSCFPSLLRLPPCWLFSLSLSPLSLVSQAVGAITSLSQNYICLIASIICTSYSWQINAWVNSHARCHFYEQGSTTHMLIFMIWCAVWHTWYRSDWVLLLLYWEQTLSLNCWGILGLWNL